MRFVLFFLSIFASGVILAGDAMGTWQKDQAETKTGTRSFYIFLPENYKKEKPIPLVVMLHGCLQDAEGFALDTGMNIMAQNKGFAVVYPEQSYKENTMKCWNWFDPNHMTRGQGEVQSIIDVVNFVAQKYVSIADNSLFIAGLSAGAAMAISVAACHNDIFSGAAVHSGLEFRAATSQAEAREAMRLAPRHDLGLGARAAAACAGKDAKPLAIFVVHGGKDNVVNPLNSERIIQQFAKIHDFTDDGRENGSKTAKLIESKSGNAGGLSFTLESYGTPGNAALRRLWVPNLEHKWCGASRNGSYADARGPAAAEYIWNFFESQMAALKTLSSPDLSRKFPATHTEPGRPKQTK